MSRKLLLLFFITCKLLLAEIDTSLSNTNFTISEGSIFPNDDTRYLYNYDRVRMKINYNSENIFASLMGDGVNYLGRSYVNSPTFSYTKRLESDTPNVTQSNFYNYYEGTLYVKVYRLYGGYEDEQNRIVIGLQNITMGVGRIWNPTNLFNPRNTYALEPDETFGVYAISYTRHIGESTDITVVTSQKKDFTYKYALKYKTFLEYADIGVNVVLSDETSMLGYEIEANLVDSGIEVRSEGAYIKNDLHVEIDECENIEFFQGLVGADYGFENGISVVFEALYTSKTFDYATLFLNLNSEIVPNLLYSDFYLGSSLDYSFNLFLEASLGYIESFNSTNSRFITPSITYTINDFNSLSFGAMLNNGSKTSEFGMFSDTYYCNYSLAF